jgi:hypothetical protein
MKASHLAALEKNLSAERTFLGMADAPEMSADDLFAELIDAVQK